MCLGRGELSIAMMAKAEGGAILLGRLFFCVLSVVFRLSATVRGGFAGLVSEFGAWFCMWMPGTPSLDLKAPWRRRQAVEAGRQVGKKGKRGRRED